MTTNWTTTPDPAPARVREIAPGTPDMLDMWVDPFADSRPTDADMEWFREQVYNDPCDI